MEGQKRACPQPDKHYQVDYDSLEHQISLSFLDLQMGEPRDTSIHEPGRSGMKFFST